MASNFAYETLSLADYPSQLSVVLHVPKRSLIKVPHWNNCPYLSFSTTFSYVIAIEGF